MGNVLPNIADLQKQIATLQAERDAAKAKLAARSKITFKVSTKGGVSVYGLGRFPVTLYATQWGRLLAEDTRRALAQYLTDHASELAVREITAAA